MLEGIIIKGIGGFYYVKTKEDIIECRARGLFRNQDKKPLVGDCVKLEISEEDSSGYIIELLPRQSELTRPPVANVNHAIVVFSVSEPELNLWLLDRILLMIEQQDISITICINKANLNLNKANRIRDIYKKVGYQVLLTDVISKTGINELEKRLENQISVFAGPSGVGKSTLINTIMRDIKLETGSVSNKTKRGKHTTRHAELIEINPNTFVLDTPGFSSLNLSFINEPSELKSYYKEFTEPSKSCKYTSCLHNSEPDCKVKKEVERNIIPRERYENYIMILEEIEKGVRY